MQGVKGGEDRPKPDAAAMESETSQQMRKAGFERAQAEEWQKKGVVEKLQSSAVHAKDVVAETVDKIGAATKNIIASSED